MSQIQIFIASSNEVSEDRETITNFIHSRNIESSKYGIQLIPRRWEDESIRFDLPENESNTANGKQALYNQILAESNIIVFLFGSRVGNHTMEEFEEAIRLLSEPDNKEKHISILVYFKEVMVPSLSVNENEIKSLMDVKKLEHRIRHELKQIYGTYTTGDELLLKFDSELNKELLNQMSKMQNGFNGIPSELENNTGNIITPADSHIVHLDEPYENIDIACNSGANVIQKNADLLAQAFARGARIRVMVNDPSLEIFNGTTTFSKVFCKDNAGQPSFTETALKELNRIYCDNPGCEGSIEVKIANYAITGQLVIINNRYVSYIPYIPNIEINDLFKIEFPTSNEMVENIAKSFAQAWDKPEMVSKTVIDITNESKINDLVRSWFIIKQDQSTNLLTLTY
ncbi:MAG: hypothetical protein FWH40_00770 [Coriobacteriia bacterium]|nr:hypothetical protein [Coriobacteriia bacterium]